MKELSVNHLLGIKYINNSDIDLILRQPTILRKSLIVLLRRSLRYETLPLLIYFLKIAPGQNFPSNWHKRLSADVISFQQHNHL
jgi:aspartate carbamoyltransferase catalytic subunit